MKCNHGDCFTCPYPDCILEDTDKIKQEYNPEIKRRYYQKHKAERLAYQKAYNEAHKADKHERSKKYWANMTEEQKEKERARQREYHRRKKANAIV